VMTLCQGKYVVFFLENVVNISTCSLTTTFVG